MVLYTPFTLYILINICTLSINSSVLYLDPLVLISEEKGTLDNPYKTLSKIFNQPTKNDKNVLIYIMNDISETFENKIVVQNRLDIMGYNKNEKTIHSENLRFLIDGGLLELKYIFLKSNDFISFDILSNGSVSLQKVCLFGYDLKTNIYFLNVNEANFVIFDTVTFKNINFLEKSQDFEKGNAFIKLAKIENIILKNLTLENCKFENSSFLYLENVNACIQEFRIRNTILFSFSEKHSLILGKNSNILIKDIVFTSNSILGHFRLITYESQIFENNFKIENFVMKNEFYENSNGSSKIYIMQANFFNIVKINFKNITAFGSILFKLEKCKYLAIQEIIFHLISLSTMIECNEIDTLFILSSFFSHIILSNSSILILSASFFSISSSSFEICNSISSSLLRISSNSCYFSEISFLNNFAIHEQDSITQVGCLYYNLGSRGVELKRIIYFKNAVISNFDFGSPCIFANSEDDELNIENSFFIENQSSNYDICISHHGKKIIISNSTFIHNENEKMDEGSKGALNLASAIIILKNVNFDGNRAAYGSAILIQNSFSKAFTYGYFENIKIKNNIALYGQILFHSNLRLFNFSFLNSHFMNNLCLIKGGVVLTWYHIYGNLLSFISCYFIENSSNSFGGVFYIANLGNHIILTNCSFLNNKVLKRGGGGVICVYGDPNTIIITQNSYFLNNSSPTTGGVFLITTGILIEKGSKFINNMAQEGGSFTVNFFSILELRSSLIHRSTSISNAGLIKIMGQSDVKFINCIIKENFAPRGGVFVTGGLTVLTIEDTLFEANSAVNGTILYATNTAFMIFFMRSKIRQNEGSRNLFELNSCSLYFEDVEFDGNRLNLFTALLSNLILIFVFVQNNLCEIGQLGCILNLSSESEILIESSRFYNINSTGLYGNIYLSTSKINISKSFFEKLVINLEGSLIYGDDSNVFLNDTSLYDYASIAIKLTQSKFYLLSTKIEQNIKIDNKNLEASIVCLRCKNISMYNSTILNTINYFDKIAALTIIRNLIYESYQYEIINSYFTNNIGISGGAIYIENSNITILNSIFDRNKGQNGGSIFLSCEDTLICNWIITSNTFISNKANVSGGAIKWESGNPIVSRMNVFKNNTALFGDDVSSQPVKIFAINLKDFTQFNEYKSGDTTTSFQFQIIDYYHQIVQGINGFCLISLKVDKLDEINSLNGLLQIEIQEKKFKFNSLTLVASPNSIVSLAITTSLIKKFYKNLLKDNQETEIMFSDAENNSKKQYEFLIRVFSRPCRLGEIFINHKNICQRCSEGQFSISINDTTCSECLPNTFCHGGANVSLNAGFWRRENSSKDIYECLIDGACLGGSKSEDICLYGYSGPLCDVCVANETVKFYKYGGIRCDNCEELNPLGFMLFAALYLLLIIYVRITIKKNINSSENDGTYQNPVYLKIGMDYLQVLSIISILNIKWPLKFSNAMNTFGMVGNLHSSLFPFECLLLKLSKLTNLFYLKIYVGSIFVWFNILLAVIILIFFLKLKHRAISLCRKEIVITLMVVGFTLQPSVVNMYFTVLNCIEISGELYVKKQLNLKCWDGDYITKIWVFILPSLLLWNVILPFICWIYVKQNINSPKVQVRLSLAYILKGIRKKFYYWEFVMMVKRNLLGIISIFMISNITVAVCSILFVLYFFSMIHYKIRPYKMAIFNHIMDFSFLSSKFTYMLCLYYVIGKDNSLKLISLIFILIFILAFLLNICKMILFTYKEKLKNILSKSNSSKKKMRSFFTRIIIQDLIKTT